MLHALLIETFLSRLPALRTTALLTVCAGGVLATGCATMVNGPRQVVAVSSSPFGATVCVDGEHAGTTPCQLSLERKRNHVLQFSKAGYLDATALVTRKWSGVGLGNILVGGIIGVGVDASTGSDYRLEPSRIEVALQPESERTEATTQPSGLSASPTRGTLVSGDSKGRSTSR